MSLRGANCLVLGAGGFIGTTLCRALADQGAAVRAFGRPSRDPEAANGSAHWYVNEFSDLDALARAIEGVGVVFHLLGASVPAWANQSPADDLTATVAPTLRMLDLAVRHGVGKVVFLSSGGGVYGVARSIPIPESAPTDPISAYGVNKLAIEKYLGFYQHTYGLDCTVLRVSNAFGPHQSGDRPQGLIANAIKRLLDREPFQIWGDGSVVRDYVYVEDLVQAIVKAARYRGPSRVFNVGEGVGRSIRQVLEDLGRTTGEAPKLVFSPARSIDAPINVLDIDLADKELAWRPSTPWVDALAATVQWMRSRREHAGDRPSNRRHATLSGLPGASEGGVVGSSR